MKCKNCGAEEFIQENGKTRCSYCHTEYSLTRKKGRSRRTIWTVLFLIGIALVFMIAYLVIKTDEPTRSAKPDNSTSQSLSILQKTSSSLPEVEQKQNQEQAYAEKNISIIPGWTIEKYNAIQLAAFQKHKNDNLGDYVNGTKMADLEKEIGTPPTSLVEYTQYYPAGTAVEGKAIWSSGESLTDGSVSISVIYDKDSDQILHKGFSGQIYDLHPSTGVGANPN